MSYTQTIILLTINIVIDLKFYFTLYIIFLLDHNNLSLKVIWFNYMYKLNKVN